MGKGGTAPCTLTSELIMFILLQPQRKVLVLTAKGCTGVHSVGVQVVQKKMVAGYTENRSYGVKFITLILHH